MYAVTLVNLPTTSIRRPAEHSGLASMHAFLNQSGVNVEIIDSYAENKDLEDCWSKIEKRIMQLPNMIIGFTPFVTSVAELLYIGEKIKNKYPKVFVIIGGHFATFHKEYLLNNYSWLDAVIVGEGELTLLEYSYSPIKEDIPGVMRRNTRFIPRARIKELDMLPFQTRYLSPEKLKDEPMSIVTGRGCYAACTFCSIPSFYKTNSGPAQTARSVHHIVNEIKELLEKYNKTSFKIVDDSFFRISDKDNLFLYDLVSEIKKINKNLIFRLSARPNDITNESARLLKEMGTSVVAIGGESAHEDSLTLFNKRITVNDTRRAANILRQSGIAVLMNFITFDPILDLQGLKENLQFIKEHASFCIFHRINSHLWLRATDPILKNLVDLGLVTGDVNSFPYVPYKYQHNEVFIVKKYFDYHCSKNMKDYYDVVERLMAPNEPQSKALWEKYYQYMVDDINILEQLIYKMEMGTLEDINVITNELFENLRLFV